jgi:hypothetical protein
VLGDEVLGLLMGDRLSVEVADDLWLAAGQGQPGPLGESGGDHAQGLAVGGATLGHLGVVDRGELRVELAGGVGGLDELAAQRTGPALVMGWCLRSVWPV